MHFTCMRCAHRQAEDARCDGCGNDVVQDMRDARARRYLYEAESRWQRKRHARHIAFGTVVAILLGVFLYRLIFPLMLGTDESGAHVSDPFGARGLLQWLPVIIGACGGLGVVALFEIADRGKRRFPFLDDYEKSADVQRAD
jgi:hypothetical protein